MVGGAGKKVRGVWPGRGRAGEGDAPGTRRRGRAWSLVPGPPGEREELERGGRGAAHGRGKAGADEAWEEVWMREMRLDSWGSVCGGSACGVGGRTRVHGDGEISFKGTPSLIGEAGPEVIIIILPKLTEWN